MGIIALRDRDRIARHFLSRDPYLHIYEMGDLDDRFWPHTHWYGLEAEGEIREIALLYARPDPPVLIALAEGAISGMETLLRGIDADLPARCYAHLSPGLAGLLRRSRRVESRGAFLKMGLLDAAMLDSADTARAVRLAPADRAELEALYAASYPGNWFDPWMLETGRTFGVREAGRIVSVAGIHVVSQESGVAALGNIATDPAARGRGLARIATAALCLDLLAGGVRTIGLNVAAGNRSAIACYERLGFRSLHPFEEAAVEPMRNLGTARDSPRDLPLGESGEV